MISETDLIAIQNLFQEIEGIRGSCSVPFSQLTENELKEFNQPIERKMDFSTLKKNLNDNNYKSLDRFKEDLSLIWSNVLRYYNKEKIMIINTARRIENICYEFFYKNYNKQQNEEASSKCLNKKRKINSKKKKNKKNVKHNKKEKQGSSNQKNKKNENNKNTKKEICSINSEKMSTSIELESPSHKQEENKEQTKNEEFNDKDNLCIKTKTIKETTNQLDNAQNNIEEEDSGSLSPELNDDDSESCMNNNENKEENNDDEIFNLNFTENDKLQVLILLSKLSEQNQVLFLNKIEEPNPQIITIDSGNLFIHYKYITKQHYMDMMQFGNDLLLSQAS